MLVSTPNGEVQTDDLSIQQMAELKQSIDDEIDDLKHKIQIAQARTFTTGKYADPVWYANANDQLRRLRRVAQRLQDEAGRRRKAIKVQDRPLVNFFVDICKERMDEETFLRVMEAARQRKNALYKSI